MCGNYREWSSGDRMASPGTPRLIMEHGCRVIGWCVILTWIVQSTEDREDVPWERTVWENILTSPSLSLSICRREGGMGARRSRGWHSVTCMNAGSGAWNSWGAAGGDPRKPSCSLVFHSRLLTLPGAQGAYSSHTASSSNTGVFLSMTVFAKILSLLQASVSSFVRGQKYLSHWVVLKVEKYYEALNVFLVHCHTQFMVTIITFRIKYLSTPEMPKTYWYFSCWFLELSYAKCSWDIKF